MNIADFLSPAAAMIDVRAPDKRTLLNDLAQRAAATLGLPADRIALALLKREELGSTGVGGGVALPHAKVEGVTAPFGILARLAQPIAYEAIDGTPVDLVFVLLLPVSADKDQLSALASVARKLRVPETLGRLRAARSGSELHRIAVA
jgi:PTS system nitrogen regulatory IIA component